REEESQRRSGTVSGRADAGSQRMREETRSKEAQTGKREATIVVNAGDFKTAGAVEVRTGLSLPAASCSAHPSPQQASAERLGARSSIAGQHDAQSALARPGAGPAAMIASRRTDGARKRAIARLNNTPLLEIQVIHFHYWRRGPD